MGRGSRRGREGGKGTNEVDDMTEDGEGDGQDGELVESKEGDVKSDDGLCTPNQRNEGQR